MSYLFFDTETTGLPRRHSSRDPNDWPRMVQLAWAHYSQQGELLSKESHIIKPVGFTIPTQAAQIHGISTQKALALGVELGPLLHRFRELLDGTNTLVAHNLIFDQRVMEFEYLRKEIAHGLYEKKGICTKERSTNYCKLPGRFGYKWPKLEELYQILFNEKLENAHDAGVDVEACARCFFELKRRGIIK